MDVVVWILKCAFVILLFNVLLKLLVSISQRFSERKHSKHKPKKSFMQFLAAVIGSLYTLYLINYFYNLGSDFASSLATFIVTPHMLCCALGSVFMWVAFFNNSRAMSLSGAILYCVAAVIFLTYAPMTLPIIILGFIGWARIGRINQKATEEWHYEQTDFDGAFDNSSDTPVRRTRRRRSHNDELQ